MAAEHQFDDSKSARIQVMLIMHLLNKTLNKDMPVLSKQIYYRQKILYCRGDWSILSIEIDDIFCVIVMNGEGHSGGDTVEDLKLYCYHFIDHISESPTIPIEGLCAIHTIS